VALIWPEKWCAGKILFILGRYTLLLRRAALTAYNDPEGVIFSAPVRMSFRIAFLYRLIDPYTSQACYTLGGMIDGELSSTSHSHKKSSEVDIFFHSGFGAISRLSSMGVQVVRSRRRTAEAK